MHCVRLEQFDFDTVDKVMNWTVVFRVVLSIADKEINFFTREKTEEGWILKKDSPAASVNVKG